jgi:hypothetical protein
MSRYRIYLRLRKSTGMRTSIRLTRLIMLVGCGTAFLAALKQRRVLAGPGRDGDPIRAAVATLDVRR